jgi:hypothetical protein
MVSRSSLSAAPCPCRPLVVGVFFLLTLAPTHAFAWKNVGSGSAAVPCNSYYQGSLGYNYTSNTVEFCNGTSWGNLLAAGSSDDPIDLGTSVTATNPSIAGDLTSGLFSPAASSVAIATGGVQQVTVNSSGYVGIGTAAPRAILDLGGNTGALILPIGVTGAEPSPAVNGMIRYNSTYPDVEAYIGNVWTTLTTGGDSASIYLGTAASATDPQRTSEATTGFYSLNSSEIDAAVNVSGTGTQIMKLTSGGENIVSGTLTVNNNGIVSSPGAAVLHLGAADAAAPVAQTLGVQNVVAGTSNTAGADFTIAGSQGTGTGAGGRILFRVAPASGSSGTTQNALGTAPLYITSNGGGGVVMSTIGASVPDTISGQIGLHNGNGVLTISSGGSDVASIGTYGSTFYAETGITLPGQFGFFGWSSSGTPEGGNFTPDTLIGREGAANVQLGGFDAAGSPTAQAFGPQGVHPGGGRTNIAGANWSIYGSRGLGNAAGGDVIFQTALPGASGGTQNALVTAMQISGTTGYVGIGTASPAAKLDIYGSIDIGGVNGVSIPAAATDGSSSIAVGNSALGGGGGGYNTAVGADTLNWISTGQYNTAVGNLAMFGVFNALLTGGYNTALGYRALVAVHGTGSSNTAIGSYALSSNTTGVANTVLGYGVAQTTLATGNNNILVGTDNSTDTTSSSASNTLNIGNTIYGTNFKNGTNTGGNGYIGIGTAAPAEPLEIYSSGSGVLLQLAGSSGTCNHTPGSSSETVSCTSDMRLKSNVIDTSSALPWLSSIRVRDFTWKNTGQKRTGVIAQELQKTRPEMVTYDKTKDQWTVEQPNPWTLVKILQEQQAEIDDLKKQLASKR